ncbi:HHR046Cp [Eremothecium sinecaudum]|uniref:HHR046Cp n=1 Tax=Eremothecium sinecaudum TaxID=45286 RepID=A0A120K2W6_9SACH|nr:HHR046Cp [Eremothecium sinecaudum]AMD22815.1 HHR046Cp [Eremothecium sinecaudum]
MYNLYNRLQQRQRSAETTPVPGMGSEGSPNVADNSLLLDFFDAINNEVNSFNRMLTDVTRPMSNSLLRSGHGRRWLQQQLGGSGIVPLVDMLELEDSYEVHASIPGVNSADDIALEFHSEKNELVISGDIPERETIDGQYGWRMKERDTGHFQRAIVFSEHPGVDFESITAKYTNGVLKLVIPKLAPGKDEGEKVFKIKVENSE